MALSGLTGLSGLSSIMGSAIQALLSSPLFAEQATTNTQDMGADGYNWSQAYPITIDAFDRIIAMAQGPSGHQFVYSNDPETDAPSWATNSGYTTETFLTRGCVALDPTNDVLHVLWVAANATDGVIYRRYTINRGGSNTITSISKDTGVNLQLDYQTTGTMEYQHPIMLFLDDAAYGTYGAILAIWACRNTGTGGTGNEIRASMCVLGSTADAGATAGNWSAPVAADTSTIGNAPQVDYSALVANATASIMHQSIGRKMTGTNALDLYLAYADGANVNTIAWKWARIQWNGTSNDWADGVTTPATITAIQRDGSDTGYSAKYQLGTKVIEDTTHDRMAFGFASWKDNTNGDTWSFVLIDAADVLSSVADVYSAGGAHDYAPTGDIVYDATEDAIVVSYIDSPANAAYVAGYRGTAQIQAPLLAFNTQDVDIPLLGERFGDALLPVLFRDTQTGDFQGWFGTLLYPGGSRPAPSAPTQPDDIAGLLAWWKTESIVSPTPDTAISSWPDASTNGRTATPNGAGFVYRAGVINGRAAIAVVGAEYAPFTSANLGTSHTMFAVIRPIADFGDGVILGGNATGKYMPYLDGSDLYYRALSSEGFATVAHGGLSTNTAYLIGIVRSGTSVSFYKNASLLGSPQTLSVDTALTIVQLSGLAGGTFNLSNCQIAEVIVYDSALGTTDRQAIEAYLNDRFALY